MYGVHSFLLRMSAILRIFIMGFLVSLWLCYGVKIDYEMSILHTSCCTDSVLFRFLEIFNLTWAIDGFQLHIRTNKYEHANVIYAGANEMLCTH